MRRERKEFSVWNTELRLKNPTSTKKFSIQIFSARTSNSTYPWRLESASWNVDLWIIIFWTQSQRELIPSLGCFWEIFWSKSWRTLILLSSSTFQEQRPWRGTGKLRVGSIRTSQLCTLQPTLGPLLIWLSSTRKRLMRWADMSFKNSRRLWCSKKMRSWRMKKLSKKKYSMKMENLCQSLKFSGQQVPSKLTRLKSPRSNL